MITPAIPPVAEIRSGDRQEKQEFNL